MSSAVIQHFGWPRRRLLGATLLVFVLQLALIFCLSDRAPVHARSLTHTSPVHLSAPSSAEILALHDPTLFALPHQQGFSGQAWMTIPPQPVHTFSWSEEPRWLTLDARQLGADFNSFIATNNFRSSPTVAMPEPIVALPEPRLWPAAAESSLRIEGDLAQRPLLAPLALRSWPQKDLLTNTVVQMLVDADGRPISLTLLRPGSGSQLADAYALTQASAARFAPLADNAGSSRNLVHAFTWGKLIFEWQTVPEVETNAP